MIDFKNGALIKLKKIDQSIAKDAAPLFIAGEEIIGCYKALRDYMIFTDRRIISVNVQGVTGKKKDFSSLPYSRIQAFSVETTGVLDLDSELELYFSGLGLVHFDFSGDSNITAIGQYISNRIL